MATKKNAVKKAKKPATAKKNETKIIVEVVVKNETAAATAAPFNALLHDGEGEPEPNFEFKFTPTEGVKLSKIDIDGNIFRGPALVKASKTDADGKLVISVFADPMTSPIPMILEAVGEPNRSMGFTLKFEDNDVFKATDNKKIVIADNRFGFLALPSVNLP
jgi:hypothetical protein